MYMDFLIEIPHEIYISHEMKIHRRNKNSIFFPLQHALSCSPNQATESLILHLLLHMGK